MAKKSKENKFKKNDLKRSFWKNQNFWLAFFTAVMAIAIVFQAITLNNQTKILESNSQPPYPVLELELINKDSNRYFPIWRVTGLMINPADLNYSFRHEYEEIDFTIINIGKVSARIVNFDEYFDDKDLNGNAGHANLKDKDQERGELVFWDDNCWGGDGKELYEEAKEDCDNSTLEPGVKNIILEVDCASCINSNNPTCFEFDICIYGQDLNKEWCEQILPEEDFKFKKIDCPE